MWCFKYDGSVHLGKVVDEMNKTRFNDPMPIRIGFYYGIDGGGRFTFGSSSWADILSISEIADMCIGMQIGINISEFKVDPIKEFDKVMPPVKENPEKVRMWVRKGDMLPLKEAQAVLKMVDEKTLIGMWAKKVISNFYTEEELNG